MFCAFLRCITRRILANGNELDGWCVATGNSHSEHVCVCVCVCNRYALRISFSGCDSELLRLRLLADNLFHLYSLRVSTTVRIDVWPTRHIRLSAVSYIRSPTVAVCLTVHWKCVNMLNMHRACTRFISVSRHMDFRNKNQFSFSNEWMKPTVRPTKQKKKAIFSPKNGLCDHKNDENEVAVAPHLMNIQFILVVWISFRWNGCGCSVVE